MAEPIAPVETPEKTPAPDPAALRFDTWAQTPATPAAPAAPIAPATAPHAAPVEAPGTLEIDADTLSYIQQREQSLRQDFDNQLRDQAAESSNANARTSLWGQFQAKYPEFKGEEDFIATSFQSITGGRIPEDPSLYDVMLSRVYDHAIGRRADMIERGGLKVVDPENPAEGRTVGIEGDQGSTLQGSPMDPKPGEEAEEAADDSTLTSILVELQGQTEFFPDTTPEMLKLYKRGNLRS